ncbi:MAG: ABC transporter permease [Bdellovibrionales bacterium]|nr:ABC transporter permease [Bdellovibrionales bacterium]
MSLLRYCIRRIFFALPILFGITLVTFILFHLVGGDPAFLIAGKNASLERVASIRSELGLDRSLLQQYISFVKQTVTFDWGRSWSSQERVMDMFWRGLGPSLSLALPAFLISFLISLGIALLSSYYRGQCFDRGVLIACLALMSFSYLVYIILFQYLFAYKMGLFPITGWDPSWSGRWQYLILPWMISVTVSIGPGVLIYRTAILDESLQGYVRTARAKGLKDTAVYSQHILKNALVPILTIVIMQMPLMITGSLLLESFFGIPGVGGLLIQAIQNADFPVIKAMTVIGSIFYMLFNLLSDLVLTAVDPRIELK